MDLFKLNAPDGAGSASFDGVEYLVENGSISVPAEAIEPLAAFGFEAPKPKRASKARDDADASA